MKALNKQFQLEEKNQAGISKPQQVQKTTQIESPPKKLTNKQRLASASYLQPTLSFDRKILAMRTTDQFQSPSKKLKSMGQQSPVKQSSKISFAYPLTVKRQSTVRNRNESPSLPKSTAFRRQQTAQIHQEFSRQITGVERKSINLPSAVSKTIDYKPEASAKRLVNRSTMVLKQEYQNRRDSEKELLVEQGYELYETAEEFQEKQRAMARKPKPKKVISSLKPPKEFLRYSDKQELKRKALAEKKNPLAKTELKYGYYGMRTSDLDLLEDKGYELYETAKEHREAKAARELAKKNEPKVEKVQTERFKATSKPSVPKQKRTVRPSTALPKWN